MTPEEYNKGLVLLVNALEEVELGKYEAGLVISDNDSLGTG